MSKAYKDKVEVINIITAPEIEMLIIINEGKYDKFKKSKFHKPSEYCKSELKYDSVKNELGFTKKELAELQRCLTNEMNETKSLYHWMVYGRGLASESPNKIYSGWEGIKREKYDAIKRSLL